MPVVSNTSPISNLTRIGRLNLLREQFSEVWIPRAVEKELRNVPDLAARKAINEAKHDGWLKLRPASNAKLVNLLMVELHREKPKPLRWLLRRKRIVCLSMNEKVE